MRVNVAVGDDVNSRRRFTDELSFLCGGENDVCGVEFPAGLLAPVIADFFSPVGGRGVDGMVFIEPRRNEVGTDLSQSLSRYSKSTCSKQTCKSQMRASWNHIYLTVWTWEEITRWVCLGRYLRFIKLMVFFIFGALIPFELKRWL